LREFVLFEGIFALIQIILHYNIVHVRSTTLSHNQWRIAVTGNKPEGNGPAAFGCSTTDLGILGIPDSGAMHVGSDEASR